MIESNGVQSINWIPGWFLHIDVAANPVSGQSHKYMKSNPFLVLCLSGALFVTMLCQLLKGFPNLYFASF